MGFNFKHALEDIQLSHTLENSKAERFLRSVVKDIEQDRITYVEIESIVLTLSEKSDRALLTSECYTKSGHVCYTDRVFEETKMAKSVLNAIKIKLKSEGFKVEKRLSIVKNVIESVKIIF